MIFNSLKIAVRAFGRNRLHSFINVAGLAASLAAALLMLLWVANELSYDRFHRKADRIYRINPVLPAGELNARDVWTSTPAPLVTMGKAAIPELEEAVRVQMTGYYSKVIKTRDKTLIEKQFAYVDPGFFTLFDFPLRFGNPLDPFPDNQSVILSETMAQKLFDGQNPVGRTIAIDTNSFTVSGVVGNFPGNSSIRAEILQPLGYVGDRYKPTGYWKSLDSDWGNFNYQSFIVPAEGVPADLLADKLARVLHDNKPNSADMGIELQPLHTLHLTQANGEDGGMKIVRIFMALAIIILAIACINYVNLTTAAAAKRAREVGVRKLNGAGRAQLIGQFMAESGVVLTAALVLSAGIIFLLLPVYETISDAKLSLKNLNTSQWATIALTLTAAWAATGLYPALLLSGFQPAKALRGQWLLGKASVFQKSLVVTQFAFSVAIIMSALVINKQLQFTMQKDLGFDRNNVLVFALDNMKQQVETMKSDFSALSGVSGVTTLGGTLLQGASSTDETDWEGCPEPNKLMMHKFSMGAGFLKTLNVSFVEGRDFNGTASGASGGYILNEAAVRAMGIQNPVGKRFSMNREAGLITGVVRDFHFTSLHTEIKPAAFVCDPENANYRLYARVSPAAFPQAIALAERYWAKNNPILPFKYQFLDETYEKLYRKEQRAATLFNFFAALTILISCLGLFGLAVHSTQQRTKEVGIRKVLGASVSGIARLLAQDFMRLVVLGMLIATPFAWYAMHNWLTDFAYKIPLTGWIFGIGGLLACTVALFTVSTQTVRAALANPAKSLRSE